MTALNRVVRGVLGLAEDHPTSELRRADDSAWTSLKHVELMVTLEEEYGVSFTSREMAAVATVGQLRELLLSKGVLPCP